MDSAADTGGDIFFATGNSDPSATTWSAKTNLSESVVALSSDLTHVESHFSPPPGYNDVQQLEVWDGDFGSGGVMLLPPQRGHLPNLAVAAGKAGILYLLDADDLGIARNSENTQYVGGCWCGESYFQDNTGKSHVVASGGGNVNLYALTTTGKHPQLSWQWGSAGVPNGQNGGFFTSVSSHDRDPTSAVIWAVSRPTDSSPADIYLYAFDASGNNLIPGGNGLLAGTWPNVYGDSNTVPTVADGEVFVASYQSLAIFGLGSGTAAHLPQTHVVDMRTQLAAGQHEIFGMVKAMTGERLTVVRRDGSTLIVDASAADRHYRMAEPSVGRALIARGAFDALGILHADTILHALQNPKMWQPDR